MTGLASSRRTFFRQLAVRAEELAAAAPGAEASVPSVVSSDDPRELRLGRLAEFPVGARRRFVWHGIPLTVAGTPEGLRAALHVAGETVPVPLRMAPGGELRAVPAERCDPKMVLSYMTGEMVRAEEGETDGG